MSMSNASELALLNLLFKNVAWADVGDAAGLQPSGAAGDMYISLHTADPGETGTQATSEISYTGYSRISVARSGVGWNVSLDSGVGTATNAAVVQFGECTGGTGTVTHFAIGLQSSGAGAVLYSGALDSSRTISTGVTPLFNAGTLKVTAD